ncbi:GNAT family N-acetyltransferase [Marinibactrum halimedae]|uniref:N-acetyltransferase n=1 Tax=Marinibactrum halimedae TaxID=1444977 RepID=A0AA37T5D3_9GAMM|nr:GNAT family N-acetyltransferase [Marinibactrum halimedae]MCD9460552.1 GNAT family N-acetyltransferase [Marinibactrum halimedae]GLS27180.1 N-acetyltransferase [Marinibactrum halimedae]
MISSTDNTSVSLNESEQNNHKENNQKETVEIRRIEAYETLSLRSTVLRPGQPESECVFPGDDEPTTFHFGALLNNNVIGIVSIFSQEHEKISSTRCFRIRAMATDPEYRHLGLGRKLLQAAEHHARQFGAEYLWANARTVAQDFYKKCGYDLDNTIFNIEDIGPHIWINKTLS